MTEEKKFKIEFITDADTDQVIEFLCGHYYIDTPTNKCVNNVPCDVIKNWSKGAIRLGYSYKAIELETGKIVGVLLNRIVKPAPFVSRLDICTNPRYKIILRFIEFLKSEKFRVFDEYPEYTEIMEADILSVSNHCRRWGIATELLERTLEYTKEHGVKACMMVCSSLYSSRLCEKFGFFLAYRYRYADYIVDGKQPVMPAPPHEYMSFYIKKLD